MFCKLRNVARGSWTCEHDVENPTQQAFVDFVTDELYKQLDKNEQTLFATIYVRILFVVVLFSFSISILNQNFDMRVSRDKADAAAEGVYSVDIFVSDPMEYPNAAFAYADLIDAGLLKVTH